MIADIKCPNCGSYKVRQTEVHVFYKLYSSGQDTTPVGIHAKIADDQISIIQHHNPYTKGVDDYFCCNVCNTSFILSIFRSGNGCKLELKTPPNKGEPT